MASFRIRFLPEGIETTVEEGKTLLEAAREANIYVGAICGGEGVCGKCRVIVREGEEPTLSKATARRKRPSRR